MRGSLLSSILLMCIGIFYLVSASRYDFGRLPDPKAGFFPTIAGIAFVLLSVSLLLVSVRSRGRGVPDAEREALTLRRLFPAILVLGGVVIHILVVETVGFLLASTALMMFLMWVRGARNWVVTTVMSAATSGVLYWLFWVVMRVPIPRGALWGG